MRKTLTLISTVFAIAACSGVPSTTRVDVPPRLIDLPPVTGEIVAVVCANDDCTLLRKIDENDPRTPDGYYVEQQAWDEIDLQLETLIGEYNTVYDTVEAHNND